MCSETSPRISFSHDLCQADVVQIEVNQSRMDKLLLESSSDFEFSIGSSLELESCSADEIFSNGVILPVQIKSKSLPPTKIHRYEASSSSSSSSFSSSCSSLPPLPPIHNHTSSAETRKKEHFKAAVFQISEKNEQKPQSNNSKSFWGFKRSSSLSCDGKRSLLCSLPLLLRSNSTGSVLNQKKPMAKDANKHSSSRLSLFPLAKSPSSSSSSSSSSSGPSFSRKPSLKKNQGGTYGNGVRINPVLNVSPPYISRKASSFLGISCSFLRNRRENKSKK